MVRAFGKCLLILLLAALGGLSHAADCYPVEQIDKVEVGGLDAVVIACQKVGTSAAYTVVTPGASAVKVAAGRVMIFPMNRRQKPLNGASYHKKSEEGEHGSESAAKTGVFHGD